MKQFGHGWRSGFPAFLPRFRIKIAIFGVSCCTEYVRTLFLSITRDLMIRLCSSTLLRRKISKRKKRKKRKCSILKEGKCDAIFFWKKYGRFLLFTHIVFSKNPLWARYCQRIFPGRIPLLSFFLFFCRGSASYFLTKTLENCARSFDNDTNGKEWQRQWCALRIRWGKSTRLCGVP